jgi:hypothetical protein
MVRYLPFPPLFVQSLQRIRVRFGLGWNGVVEESATADPCGMTKMSVFGRRKARPVGRAVSPFIF